MAAPQTIPLLLLSEYMLATNIEDGELKPDFGTARAARLRRGLINASEVISRFARRRFDERYEERIYTCALEQFGGALISPYLLTLDDDLRSVVSITNGTGSDIDADYYRLVPSREQYGPVSYRQVQLVGGARWSSGSNSALNSIALAGRWGYGGQWIEFGQALTASMNTTVTTLQATDGQEFEVGMLLKVVTAAGAIEYMYVEAVPQQANGMVSVARHVNGSQAVAHASGEMIYQWQAVDGVRDLVVRLMQWRAEQTKSVIASNVTVGDFSFPVSVDGYPKDLYLAMRDAGYKRRPRTGVAV
jgi:hypothetical protein